MVHLGRTWFVYWVTHIFNFISRSLRRKNFPLIFLLPSVFCLLCCLLACLLAYVCGEKIKFLFTSFKGKKKVFSHGMMQASLMIRFRKEFQKGILLLLPPSFPAKSAASPRSKFIYCCSLRSFHSVLFCSVLSRRRKWKSFWQLLDTKLTLKFLLARTAHQHVSRSWKLKIS